MSLYHQPDPDWTMMGDLWEEWPLEEPDDGPDRTEDWDCDDDMDES